MSELQLRLAADATVRAKKISDTQQVFSVFDVMNLVYPTMSVSWKNKKWKTLTENWEYKDELEFTEEYLKYQDEDVTSNNKKKRRFVKTPVMTIQGLQRLLVILGGKHAAEFRTIVLGVFSRYIAGDRTMLEEIHSNAVSTAPIHQAYRQALTKESVVDAAGEKRKLERQDALLELELKERNISVMGSFCGLMTLLNPDWKSDARLRLQIEDSMKTVMFGGQQTLITNGEPIATRSISVSQVAQELGMRLNHSDSIAIGKAIAAQYREQHGEPPSKHRQWVDGVEREVNSYTERDRHLVERVVLSHTRK